MKLTTVAVSEQMLERLNALVEVTGKSKRHLVEQAINSLIDRNLQEFDARMQEVKARLEGFQQ